MHVSGRFVDTKFRMLVDTGSTVSLIKSEIARKLGLHYKLENVPLWRSAGGNLLPTIEYITGPVKIGNIEVVVPVIVCLDLAYDFILGTGMMAFLGSVIDLPVSNIRLMKGAVLLIMDEREHPINITAII